MNRRGFLTGALGFLAAPAIVRASSLMPVSAQPQIVRLAPFIVSIDGSSMWVTDGVMDIGWSGPTRPQNIYAADVEGLMQRMTASLYGDHSEVGASVKAAFAS